MIEKKSSIPRELYSVEALNESFYKDIDIGKQIAMME